MLDRRENASPGISTSLALIEIDRAITNLRRGGLVVTDGARSMLVPAEAITAECRALTT
jgi:hypothetical protein